MESVLRFYPKLAREFVTKYAGAYRMHRRYRAILEKVLADPNPSAYNDIAMTPDTEGEEDALELLSATTSAQAFVRKRREMTARRRTVGGG